MYPDELLFAEMCKSVFLFYLNDYSKHYKSAFAINANLTSTV
jgi:hypothetical protein